MIAANPKLARITTTVLAMVFLGGMATPVLAMRGGGGGHHGGGGRHGGHHGHASHHRHGAHHHHGHRHMHHMGVWRAPMFWHPIGFFVTTLAVTAIVVSASDGKDYQYDNGTYYEKTDQDGKTGYTAVPAPIGATVPTLPEGNAPTKVGSKTYYYYAGTFYFPEPDGKHWTVVQAPVGAVVAYLPDGYDEVDKNNILFYQYQGVYYQPKSVNNSVQYSVVPAP